MQKGFTLIELLVVIAIIMILSSVILASLGDARGESRIQCVKDHSTEYCAGKAGTTVQEFKEMLESDKKHLADSNPCKTNE